MVSLFSLTCNKGGAVILYFLIFFFNIGINRTQFHELIKLTPDVKEPVIKIDLKVPPYTTVIAKMENWPPSCMNDKEGDGHNSMVFVHYKEDGEVDVYAIAPDQGLFHLKLYVQMLSNDPETLCSYLVSCEKCSDHHLGFPVISAKADQLNVLYWTDSSQRNSHVAESSTGEITLYFKTSDASELDHFLTPCKIVSDVTQVRYHHYSAMQKDPVHVDVWRLHVVFPKCGLWTVCIATKKALILTYEVNVINLGERNGQLSYPWIQSNFIYLSNNTKPICITGKEVISILFTLSEPLDLHSVLSDGNSEYNHFSIVKKKANSDGYELLSIVPSPGEWVLYLLSSSQDCCNQILLTCYFNVIDSLYFQNSFFPIISNAIASDNNIEFESLLMKSMNSQFVTSFTCNANIHFQTQFYKGWETPNKDNAIIKHNHCATVTHEGNRSYKVNVVFPEIGRWTLLVNVMSKNTQNSTNEVAFILRFNATSSDTQCRKLFRRFYPAFYDNQIKLNCESDLYVFKFENSNGEICQFSAPNGVNMSCLMFKAEDPDTLYSNQSLIIPFAKGYRVEAVFSSIGEWCMQLYILDQVAMQLFFEVTKAVDNVTYPCVHTSFFSEYNLSISHDRLLLPSKLHGTPANLSFPLRKPHTTDIIHEATLNGTIVKGATQVVPDPIHSGLYEFLLIINDVGKWEIKLFAIKKTVLKANWTLVLTHTVSVLKPDINSIE